MLRFAAMLCDMRPREVKAPTRGEKRARVAAPANEGEEFSLALTDATKRAGIRKQV